MHSSPSAAPPSLSAFVLALLLLGAFAVIGSRVVGHMRMAPGTLLAAGAEAVVNPPGTPRTPLAQGARAAPLVESGPGWATLTTPQKLALYPLAERWALISEAQKRRWLALAASFASLPPEEQTKFHERMTDWASLSIQQRNQARLNYAVTNRLNSTDKRAQWEAYQALSEEERRALAAQAAPKPRGAATALRPVSPKKLAQVPAATQANPSRPNAPKIPPVVEHSPRMVVPPSFSTPQHPGTTAHGTPPVVVETTPVATPVAVPAPLPPLGTSATESSPTPSTPPPPVTPDTSGLYPQ